MRYRPLGKTGIMVSEIAFGAGPVSGLMTAETPDVQRTVIAHAIQSGINWFDTAAGYGAGQSEANLGAALTAIQPASTVHVATKVRLHLHGETDLRPMVMESFRQSLERLQLPRVTLLQVHNSITRNRDDEPTSVTPEDVVGPHGILAAMEDLRSLGLVDHFGLTGIGQAEALQEVIRSQQFATIQAPLHLLNPTALLDVAGPGCIPNYGQFLRDAADLGMGIMAIRVFAAGALLDASPSAHTLKTPFFPLALYERDRSLAQMLNQHLGHERPMSDWALRYVMTQREISTCILGLATAEEIDTAVCITERGQLAASEQDQLQSALRLMNVDSTTGCF